MTVAWPGLKFRSAVMCAYIPTVALGRISDRGTSVRLLSPAPNPLKFAGLWPLPRSSDRQLLGHSMNAFRKIALKLAVLAGIPVLGVALLSLQIERAARDRARSAEAIGSIEDLADLSAHMTDTVDQMQTERALAALSLGLRENDSSASAAIEPALSALSAQARKTDDAVRVMESFLAKRDLRRLPPRLGAGLAHARVALARLPDERRDIATGAFAITALLEYYGGTNSELIDATAALTQLSSDGEMLRGLSSLVAVMQVEECDSREHAVLAHTFSKGGFSPGLYRYLVTLLTERRVHVASLASFATADQLKAFELVAALPAAAQSAAMLKTALDSTEDDLSVDPKLWFEAQQANVFALVAVQLKIAQHVRGVAQTKISETRRALRYGEGLALGVFLISLLLAIGIGRQITKSVQALAKLAGRVQREKDFSLRAVKTSHDELGMLTDAFNEMLVGIEGRDLELASHRENLERKVLTRTAELSKRNDAMRLVLDTVDQGLVTIDRTGRMSAERSRAFDAAFGTPEPDQTFFRHLSQGGKDLACTFELDWAQITEGFLPLDVALGQAKSRFQIGDNYFALAYKPVLEGEVVQGALLTLSNVTSELLARRAEAVQAEQVRTFARVMHDRTGFIGFFNECRSLLERIRDDRFELVADKLRAIHTLKGNSALFDVMSVASAAHGLEQALETGDQHTVAEASHALVSSWEAFSQTIQPILGEVQGDRCEVAREDLSALLQAIRDGRGPSELEALALRVESEPVRAYFVRAADQLRNVCDRLGKPQPNVSISDAGIKLMPRRFAGFWAAFAHVVRNVADHGLEFPDERALANKPAQPEVTIGARLNDDALLIEVSDDGRGIDWPKVRERARGLGLPHATPANLTDALFAPGLSTADEVSETSGRGVGMSAILAECRALGGACTLHSEPGRGTRLTFTFPVHDAQAIA